jgi:hypothetical protein
VHAVAQSLCLLLATRGIDARKGEEINHAEVAGDLTFPGWQGRTPQGPRGQERLVVALQ